jgi:MFS family permease
MKQSLQKPASPARHDFGIVMAARTLGFLGDMLLLTVIALRIAAAGEPWRLTVVLIAFAVPLFALAPLAGRIVDDLDSRTVLVYSGLLQAAAALAIALAPSFAFLIGAILVLQAGQAVSAPAWMALLPRVVGNESIGRATGQLSAAGAVAGMAGAALGGLIYGPFGFGGSVLINAVLFVAIGLAGAAMRTRRGRRFDQRLAGTATAEAHATETAGTSAMEPVTQAAESATIQTADTVRRDGEMPEAVTGPAESTHTVAAPTGVTPVASSGWQFCRRDALLALLIPALWALVVGGEALNVAEVFLIRGVLEASTVLYGICGAAFLLGSIVGPLLAGRVDTDRARVWWCAVTAAASGALVVCMSVSPSAWIVAGLLAVTGVLMGAFNALVVAVILVRPPDEMRGRVMATVNGTMRGFTIVALVLGGVLVQLVGARVTFAIVGVMVATSALLIRRAMRALRPDTPTAAATDSMAAPAA